MIFNVGRKTGKEGYLYLLCEPKFEDGYRLLMMQEGTGDNLLPEDIDEGYVDYINWYDVKLGELEVIENDGGMVMLKTYVSDAENGLVDFVEMVAQDAGISNPKHWEWSIKVL